jgi:hypothetical protein
MHLRIVDRRLPEPIRNRSRSGESDIGLKTPKRLASETGISKERH